MKALWLENGQIRYRTDLVEPVAVRPEDAVVRVRLAGICGTDLALRRGYRNFCGIPGHEFVGEVVSAADPNLVGRRVVGEINVGCGQCEECQRHGPRHCTQRRVLGISAWQGAFAEYLQLPIENLHLIPAGLPDHAAVFAEPLAAALAIGEHVHIRPTDRVLLVGAGRLGQLIARTLALNGCRLEVLARHEVQRKHLIPLDIPIHHETDPPRGPFDFVIEATGSPKGLAMALSMLRPRGTLILKSTYTGPIDLDASSVVVNEICLLGSRCGPFDAALRLLANRVIDPEPLIDASYALADGVKAFQHAERPGALKTLLTIP